MVDSQRNAEATSSAPVGYVAECPVPLSWRTVLRRLGPAGPLAVVAATMPAIGGIVLLLTLEPVGQWLRGHQEWGILFYILGFALFAGLALLPTYSQAVLGGWAFGFVVGFPAAMAGFVGGGLLGYIVAQRMTGDRVLEIVRERPKWLAVYQALLAGGFWKTLGIVILLRLPPNSPFAFTNLLMAATRVPPLVYALGTLIGMAPRTGAAVFIAAGLREIAIGEATAVPRWLWFTGLGLSIVVVIVIGQLAQRAITRVAGGVNTA